MDVQTLSNRIINHHPKGLSAVIQMDDQPLCKLMINIYPTGLQTTIQMDYQPLSKCMINHYQWIIIHHLNRLSVVYNPLGW